MFAAGTVREYSLDEKGLHEEARINFQGDPWGLIYDGGRHTLLIADGFNDTSVKGTTWGERGWCECRTVTLNPRCDVRCWSGCGEKCIAIFDSNFDLQIYQYV